MITFLQIVKTPEKYWHKTGSKAQLNISAENFQPLCTNWNCKGEIPKLKEEVIRQEEVIVDNRRIGKMNWQCSEKKKEKNDKVISEIKAKLLKKKKKEKYKEEQTPSVRTERIEKENQTKYKVK